MDDSNTILEVSHISKTFRSKNIFGRTTSEVSAVNDVSFRLQKQRTFGIVGESGCGKSTLARLVLRLIEADGGRVMYQGHNLLALGGEELRKLRRDIQMVFQDPFSSLNPSMTLLDNVAFPLWVNGTSKQDGRIAAHRYLEAVGIPRSSAERYPQSLSGGQRQRVAIARALVLEPKIVIADEAVSALDKSIQAQALNLFHELQQDFRLSMIFISHDLHVVELMSDTVMVMYLGMVVEVASVEDVYAQPYHPYTQALFKSTPSMDVTHKKLDGFKLSGELPSPLNPPSGCRFRTRCPMAMETCAEHMPELIEVGDGHTVACHLYGEADVARRAI
ncbi:ATP-binding cassette domain-containing protein [Paenibacillus sp. IB182496]|uniref:ATP-binding cassette domain-containing protein n=1 Tax=Paenibacillus sabuli TaxID=2772509 RepID=A0A927BW79_9BACL|nr:oligopeptide/dipeptide ABC transporter ATP-binding protein [Paenibacillus sabuli]MBD2847041.1 ATP-binding cassette domain-containing protein [Paenibacillus sabuli]